MNKINCIAIYGPSGSGKTTLINQIISQSPETFHFSVSHTTRQPRIGEEDGVDYYYVTKEKFLEMINNDEFIEYSEYAGNYYGTSKIMINHIINELKQICILDLDLNGIFSMKKQSYKTLYIMITAPSMKDLEKRLIKRCEKKENIEKRLLAATYDDEIIKSKKEEHIFDETIINKKVDKSLVLLNDFITNNIC